MHWMEMDDGMNGTGFIVFVLPFFVGGVIRVMLLKRKRGYILSGIFALISVAAWIWTKYLVNHGVDGTVMIYALMATELTAGAFVVGGIQFLIEKIRH